MRGVSRVCGVKHLSTLSCVTCRHYQRIMLSPWGNYSFRVLAKNKLGTSRPSNPTAQVCSTPPDVPHHNPRQICSENVKPRQLVITWDVRIFFTVLKFFWGGGGSHKFYLRDVRPRRMAGLKTLKPCHCCCAPAGKFVDDPQTLVSLGKGVFIVLDLSRSEVTIMGTWERVKATM